MQICRSCGERNPDRARFCMACAAPLSSESGLGESRRIVTILFADLKGSTAIGERLDPEAVRRVLTKFYDSAREVIERQGGTVEKFIGDAVMAVFGVPRVHEDDAVRGVRAAAELQHELGRMNDELLRSRYGVGLELRIGVNTGEVVAGDPSTGSSFVAGDAVNVAARLEQAAPPGEVLIGQETWQVVRDAVEVEATDPLELKGKAERVPAYRLVSLAADGHREVTPFVGRRPQLERLDGYLATAMEERRSVVVTIAGPQGIGKTELAERAMERWEHVHDARVVRIRCAPVGEGDPMGPVIGLVTGLLGSAPGATPDDVAEAVAHALPRREQASVIGSTLAGLVRGRDRPSVSDTTWAVAELAGEIALQGPLVLFVDDAHWVDDDVRSVLEGVQGQMSSALLVLRAVLPEFVASEHVVIDVPALDDVESTALLQSLAGDLPGEAEIMRHAEGNPLFLIETARMVRDRDGRASEAGALEVPTTIRGLIASRLEHLPIGEVRVLETASAIGRVFPVQAVSSIGRFDAEDVTRSVETLQGRDLLSTVAGPYGPNASFTHALVREVAYAAMVKDRRAELHELYAGWLEARGRAVPSVVAHQLEQAYRLRCELGIPGPGEGGLAARAAIALAAAGSQALESEARSAAAEALSKAATLTRDAERAIGSRTSLVAEARRAAGGLAFALGDWQVTHEMLEPMVDPRASDGDDESVYRVGVALTQMHRGALDDPELDRGRSLLQGLADVSPTVDILASLAGSWKSIDDERALSLYRDALDLDPGDPYALGNVIELEAARVGALPELAGMRSSFVAATHRCRAQIDRGENLPWACYDLAKFSLLAGAPDEGFEAACLAVARSTARFMIETSLRSLESFERLAPALEGLPRAAWLYRLGIAAGFDERALVAPLATADASPVAGPVVIVAGGSSLESEAEVRRHGPMIREVMRGGSGTLVSGATRQGVSAIAGDVAEDVPAYRAIGYLPSDTPEDVEVDRDAVRYSEIRRTRGDDFSVAEPLQYWADVITSGVPVDDVRLIAIGGGRISAAEYRIALALGARVGALRGSGGSASALLQDPWWAATPRLSELVPEVLSIHEFLDL